jgi:hypothetical protein
VSIVTKFRRDVMKEYPVGSVCIVINAHPSRQHIIGQECTIVAGRGSSKNFPDQYEVEVQDFPHPTGHKWFAAHSALKLKRPPKDEKFEEFMQAVLKPVGLPEEDLV